MVLIDKETGVLTQAFEFKSNPSFLIKEVTEPAKISEILRVHDYRYIKQVMRKIKVL